MHCRRVWPGFTLMCMDANLIQLADALGKRLRERDQTFATAESCTGGWVAKACTDLAGSSDWFECGLVTYSNRAKQRLLGVSPAILAGHGAVSEATVQAMARGVLARSAASWSVAISGIAGPGGGSEDKPVGTVWFAWAGPADTVVTERRLFTGDRDAVRRQAVECALRGLLERLQPRTGAGG